MRIVQKGIVMIEALKPHLADIWLLHMGFFLLYYAVSDGLDLGVGMISLFSKSSRERATLMGSIRSNWHGNQSWLIILAGMLFGAFPTFYAIVFSALYIPILIMLFGLVFRGVAFEFHDHSERKRLWEISFGYGSLIVSIAQGLALGAILSGNITVENGHFTGGPWAWLNPFGLLVAAGVLIGYSMLGANYLLMKTAGELQERSYRIAWGTSIVTLLVSLSVHAWVAFRYPHVGERWTTYPWMLLIDGFSLLAAAAYIALLVCIKKRREVAPIFLNAAIVVFSFTALSIGLYPYMIPNASSDGVTVAELAAAPETLMFMLYFSVVAVPVILVYTSYEYWVYRGKTDAGLEEGVD